MVRAGRAADLAAVVALDQAATGEDRRRLLTALWPTGGLVAAVDGQALGYHLASPWRPGGRPSPPTPGPGWPCWTPCRSRPGTRSRSRCPPPTPPPSADSSRPASRRYRTIRMPRAQGRLGPGGHIRRPQPVLGLTPDLLEVELQRDAVADRPLGQAQKHGQAVAGGGRHHGRRRQLGMLVVGGQQQRPAVAVQPGLSVKQGAGPGRPSPAARPAGRRASGSTRPASAAPRTDDLLAVLAVVDRQALMVGDPLDHVGQALEVVPGQGSNIDVKARRLLAPPRSPRPARVLRALWCLKQLDPSPVLLGSADVDHQVQVAELGDPEAAAVSPQPERDLALEVAGEAHLAQGRVAGVRVAVRKVASPSGSCAGRLEGHRHERLPAQGSRSPAASSTRAT